jgi:hypothetical protein
MLFRRQENYQQAQIGSSALNVANNQYASNTLHLLNSNYQQQQQ